MRASTLPYRPQLIKGITMFCESNEKLIEVRYNMTKLMKELKKRNVTTILVSEVPNDRASKYGIEEFVADGVVLLKAGYDIVGASPRSLIIKKMRRTSHDMEVHPIKIDEHGMKILSIKFDKTETDEKK